MRTCIEWNDASVVDRLRKKHDISGSLHNLVVVVVARSGTTEPRSPIGEAPNEVAEIFRPRRWTRPGRRERRRLFLVGQEWFSLERIRPFQRSGVVVQPDALKVWLTVWCPWRSPWFRCLGPRGRRLTGGKSRREPDEHDHQSAQ